MNKVFAAIKQDWDGIQHIVLFSAEHLAKTYCRKLNNESGFDAYEVKEIAVNDVVKGVK